MNHEKESKVYRVVAISFGLLCILQVTLNISLRMFVSKTISSSDDEFCGVSGHHQLAALHNLTSLVDNLTTENLQLRTENVKLERQLERLDVYCPIGNTGRVCRPCQDGWRHHSSSCYAINDADPVNRKSWQEARDDCRAKNSDLTVIDSPEEQKYIYEHSWAGTDETNGYWIGLTSESGGWRWVDGHDLTEEYWTTPPGDGLCATSVEYKSTFAVNCTAHRRWICEMKVLNV